jgi:hypothetical protein
MLRYNSMSPQGDRISSPLKAITLIALIAVGALAATAEVFLGLDESSPGSSVGDQVAAHASPQAAPHAPTVASR